ncbi:MAG: sulfite exporter TauE/SafE family protein [Deltaproteobacteria bacterium]|nr:sulfite exporter TauE/SafE family protein [Deltaproteobacteria bacterium]
MLGNMQGFIFLDAWAAVQIVILGFIGGVLSGFIGSGGAFFMTPGMMNLGVPGAIAVGSNITHKFGKALVGSLKHRELGNVDRRLALFMLVTSFAGIRLAAWLNALLFRKGGGSSSAAGDLYISIVFVASLIAVAVFMLREVVRTLKRQGAPEAEGSTARLAQYLARLNLPPMIHFRVSETRVSLWLVLVVGLFVGYMAGTIGVGGFLGVPAMIYLFGVPTTVAAGTELYLAMYMGAFGAANYAWQGMVDIRLTLLLYAGSLVGVLLGAYGTKIVKDVIVRLVTGVVIAICVVSRLIAIPAYLRQLGTLSFDPALEIYLNSASKATLFFSGVMGLGLILVFVVKAHRQRMRVQATLRQAFPGTQPSAQRAA